jgi:hypothetical protein
LAFARCALSGFETGIAGFRDVRFWILWQQGHRLLPDARIRLSSHRVSLMLIIALLPHILPLLRPRGGDRDG